MKRGKNIIWLGMKYRKLELVTITAISLEKFIDRNIPYTQTEDNIPVLSTPIQQYVIIGMSWLK